MSDGSSEGADSYERAGTSDPAEAAGLLDEMRKLRRDDGVLTGLALILPLLAQIPGLGFLLMPLPADLTVRGTFPFLIIAAGLWVLARAERSIGLAVIAAVYTGAALLASLYDIENVLYRLGWNAAPGVPNVLLAAIVLLIAGAIAFLAQRGRRSPG